MGSLISTFASSHACAQDFPSKSIRLVAPIAASGMTDIVARQMAQKLQERLGVPVVVDNKPGAGGNIGVETVVRAAPDGYTLLLAFPGPIVVNPSLYKNLAYDPVRDLAPVNLLTSYPLLLAVNAEVPAKTLAEFIALAKQKTGGLSYGSAGNASTAHLAMELFMRQAGIQMVHVPYKGAAPAMTDLIGGRLAVVFDSMTLVMPQVEAGKIRALAISSKVRSPAAPDLPTVAESGLSDFVVEGWYGVLAPSGTPEAIVNRLSKEFTAIVNDADVKKDFLKRGLEPLGKDAAFFGHVLKAERAMWHRVVTESNIKID
ncbi:MAG: tripartite tricarboxylate transporter substrate binding protein [Alcaligenaceae bacterium]